MCSSFEQLLEDVINSIKNHIADDHYAIFGHSLGGLLAFEAANKLQMSGYTIKHLFVSGVCPPHMTSEEDPIGDLPDRDFLGEIIKLGGTPPEFLDNKDLVKTFLPILRNDYKVYESYRYKLKEVNAIDCDITACIGKEDEKRIKRLQKNGPDTRRGIFAYVFLKETTFLLRIAKRRFATLLINCCYKMAHFIEHP
jgi:Predicted thioesterase involved in non-ribosomal peptide biosynthesis